MRRILFISLVLFTSILCELPTNFTWANTNNLNYIPAPRNQHFPEVCNSGWAITAANVLSSRIKINTTSFPDVQISPQVLLECDNLNFGCYGVFIQLLREMPEMLLDGLVKTTSQIRHVIRTRLIVVDNAALCQSANSVLRLVAQLNQTPRFMVSISMGISEVLTI